MPKVLRLHATPDPAPLELFVAHNDRHPWHLTRLSEGLAGHWQGLACGPVTWDALADPIEACRAPPTGAFIPAGTRLDAAWPFQRAENGLAAIQIPLQFHSGLGGSNGSFAPT